MHDGPMANKLLKAANVIQKTWTRVYRSVSCNSGKERSQDGSLVSTDTLPFVFAASEKRLCEATDVCCADGFTSPLACK